MIEAHDRVLVVGLARAAEIPAWTRDCTLLVGIGSEDAVYEARRLCASADNAMFAAGARDAIPWRDQYFTLILDTEGGEPTADMQRVLAPGGRIVIP
jgi:hypothetical protein